MNTEESRMRWYADASAVQFLDLRVREFHVKKNTTPMIFALDLSAVPRIYSIPSLPIYVMRAKNGKTVLQEISSSSYCAPSVPLIAIFGAHDFRLPNSFFDEFSRRILEKLETKWEPETMRLYLKHLKGYIHFTKNALFHLSRINYESTTMIPFERPLVFIYHDLHPRKLIKKVTPKLIKLLFDNICSDSTLVEELFRTVCIHEKFLGDLLFQYEPEITDYILHHLRKAKCDINSIWESLLVYLRIYSRITGWVKPENLRIHLNYGVENIFKKWWNTQFYETCLYCNIAFTSLPRPREHFNEAAQRTCATPETRESQILRVLNFYIYPQICPFPWILEVQRLLWKTVPLAFVTYKEIKDMAVRYFGTQFAESISNELQSYFDGFETVLQPNSLSEFSRCVIRRQLISTSQMPEGIGCLGLPSRLQSYLRMEL